VTESNSKIESVESPGLILPSTILEQIQVPGGLFKYAAHEQLGDNTWRDSVIDNFPDPSGKLRVPMKNQLWLLPGIPADYGSAQELFDELVDFGKYHHELRDNRSYEVLACFELMTWRVEEFHVVPYIDFLGPKGTGKTRGLELLRQLTYRGWLVTHPSPAVVFWVVDRYAPTLLADNYEFWPKETRRDLDGLFNAGYRRDMVVPRRPREGEGNGAELLVYRTFSPKALAGTREPVDSLASRCITIRMSRNQSEKPIEIDAKWGATLRSKLLSYRFHQLESMNARTNEELPIMNRYGRVGEIFLSLLEVAPTDEVRDRLIESERGVFEDQREDEATSLDAEVVKAILFCRDLAVDKRLAVRNIADAINSDRDQSDRIKPERIGWITNKLGFKKARMPDTKGNRAIRLDNELLQRLIRIYDINDGHTSLTPSDSQTVRKADALDKFTSDSSDSLTVTGGDEPAVKVA
jgi:hypothetical protein